MYLPIFQVLSSGDQKALIAYSNSTFGCRSIDQLEKGIKTLLEGQPGFNSSWLLDLHNDIKKYAATVASSPDSAPESMLFAYLKNVEIAYSGIGSQILPGIKGVLDAGYDITKPHLRWIVEIDNQVKSLKQLHNDISEQVLFGFVKDSHGLNISLNDYMEVKASYTPSLNQHEIRPYLAWFARSSKNFDQGHLSLESMHKISEVLQKEGNPSPVPVGVLYQLYKDLEIHPLHERDVFYWANSATKGRELQKDFAPSEFSL